jgi:hypothetical protein
MAGSRAWETNECARAVNSGKRSFVKRKFQRTRVFPLDNHILIFVLP